MALMTARRMRSRAALLVALQEVLLDPTSPGVSVPRVVSQCGVAQGTFYTYFDSLQDAIDAVGELLLTEHSRVLAGVTSRAVDAADIVARSARQTLMLVAYRTDVGRLMFDSGLPVDRLATGLRAHLDADLLLGVNRGDFAVTHIDVMRTVAAGTILGAALDLHRGRLPVEAVSEVALRILMILGVDVRQAQRLAFAPQEFVDWAPLPLTPSMEN